ncbi:hypothetical protein AALP_AAs64389U000100, partial [Arabis alpina]
FGSDDIGFYKTFKEVVPTTRICSSALGL